MLVRITYLVKSQDVLELNNPALKTFQTWWSYVAQSKIRIKKNFYELLSESMVAQRKGHPWMVSDYFIYDSAPKVGTCHWSSVGKAMSSKARSNGGNAFRSIDFILRFATKCDSKWETGSRYSFKFTRWFVQSSFKINQNQFYVTLRRNVCPEQIFFI